MGRCTYDDDNRRSIGESFEKARRRLTRLVRLLVRLVAQWSASIYDEPRPVCKHFTIQDVYPDRAPLWKILLAQARCFFRSCNSSLVSLQSPSVLQSVGHHGLTRTRPSHITLQHTLHFNIRHGSAQVFWVVCWGDMQLQVFYITSGDLIWQSTFCLHPGSLVQATYTPSGDFSLLKYALA